MIDLDGRRFVAESNSDGGHVGQGTVFDYHQDGDMVWAEYSGGAVRPGHLVGTREGDRLDCRYVRLHETWRWESRPGEGTSVLRELLD